MKYSYDDRLSVITLIKEEHLSLFETATKYGIPSDRTLRAWLRIYDCEGAEKFFRETRGRMKKKSTHPKQPSAGISEDMVLELNRLRAEVVYLKKLRALVEERIAQEKKIGHKGRYGYRRITAEMNNRGYSINHKTVLKLMNNSGIKCQVRLRKYRSYKGKHGLNPL